MTPRALDRSGALPLWRQLQDDLVARLRAGEFDTGFPGELTLVDEYGVSRYTVRQALQRLRADGLVVAERGRQPRVSPAADVEQPLDTLYSLFASVEAAGLEQRSVVRVLDVRADGVVADRLDLEGSTPLVYLERLRLAAGTPLAIDRAWLPADLAAPVLTADFTHTSLYSVLAGRTGIRLDTSREEIRAVVPTAAERALLECGPEVACLSVHRQGSADGRPVEWRHTVVRGDRFAVTAEFTAGDRRPTRAVTAR
ncbi:GntR family transcriptional regulator [Actinosynnema sp. NPDC047251]|uniref:Transcriptional regulator, GntR family n=1 Tax=Saccharothrix espanaensis (strain ATCC 51144 / DSM 44229 / JCM 9112 / NBRC 15066 / NRRL 15764) TaxID=1179773 RepID=K0JQY5_SACES|nr:GntR family transcriptional regulator [Saccharothrix espanaensis]CCH29965.1 Transcriptional regulator, GntR family [Saccharothrix espanaensis DSM 44229]